MSGGDGALRQDVERQDPSFLNSSNGPSISERGAKAVGSRLQNIVSQEPAPVSPRSGGLTGPSVGNSYNAHTDASTDVLRDQSPAAMGRSYRTSGPDRPEVSFHVNPDFDHDPHTNSDVLLQGYETHNRIPNWTQPQQGTQYVPVRTSHNSNVFLLEV